MTKPKKRKKQKKEVLKAWGIDIPNIGLMFYASSSKQEANNLCTAIGNPGYRPVRILITRG